MTAVVNDAAPTRIVEATLSGAYRAWLCGDKHARDCQACLIIKARALCNLWQQEGHPCRYDRRARGAHALAAGFAEVTDRQALEDTLVRFGVTLLREVSDPAATGLSRLSMIEAERSPEVARA